MRDTDGRYRELTEKLEKDPTYWVESMRFDYVEEVERMMEERGVSRAELARRLDSSPAYVTQLFRAMFNPTLLTLAKVAVALDAKVALHLSPVEAVRTEWLDLIKPAALPKQVAPVSCWPEDCGRPIAPIVPSGRQDERATASAA
jgi:transcriptional regulator with XRE-family HTH domain